MRACVPARGVRAEGAEVYCGSCHRRKISSFYEFLLRVRSALSVFCGILGREKSAQGRCARQMGWSWILPAKQLCWQLASAALIYVPEKASQAEVKAVCQQGRLLAC